MQIVEANPINSTQQGSSIEITIICCICGVAFDTNCARTNICVKCSSTQTDITSGIVKQTTLNYCKKCKKYCGPPWVYCNPESKELLSLCLKKIKGLNTVQLLDACFIWTEVYSKRIKIKLTVQKEVMSGPIIIQTFPVEFVVNDQCCKACQSLSAANKAEASVQIRQKVEHRKTFYFLEQLILKNNMQENILNVKEVSDGFDYNFLSKHQAQSFIEFLQNVLPIKMKSSKQLVNQDDHRETFSYKYIFCVEIPKVCKNDLVILSPKLSSSLDGCSSVLLCQKVSSMIQFLDAVTMQTFEINAQNYFQYESEMTIFPLRTHKTDFTIFDVEQSSLKQTGGNVIQLLPSTNKLQYVSVGRKTDWKRFYVKTHLSDTLKEGDVVEGFDLSTMSIDKEGLKLANMQEILLMRKANPRQKGASRIWKLKKLNKEESDSATQKKVEGYDSYEEFLNELETDPEMRSQMNLYRDENTINELKGSKDFCKIAGKTTAKKKVRVKRSKDPNAIEEEKPQGGEEEKKQTECIYTDACKIDGCLADEMIQIGELLNDLTLNDAQCGGPDTISDSAVDEFIKKIKQIYIEKC